MPTTTNQPYSLLTSHGRAQSIAHSAYGAMLADTIEAILEEDKLKLQDDAEQAIDEVINELDTNVATDHSSLVQMSIFQSELSKRDRLAFEPLRAAYSAERQILVANTDKLLKLIDKLRDILGIEE